VSWLAVPGWSTDLTGLTEPEARALLAAGSRATADCLGMAPALASGLRKLLGSMLEQQQTLAVRAASRVLVRPEGFLSDADDTPDLGLLQQAVFGGRRLRFRYTSGRSRTTSTRTVDPHGLVNAGGIWHLLATHRHADRTFRVSRIRDAAVLQDSARRPDSLDLQELWRRRRGDRTCRPAAA
jgi:predicted DNA-binding transcriptional regulator YafY